MKRLIITTLCLIFSTTLAFASGKSLGTDSNISFDSDQITSSTTDIDFVSENLITTGTATLGKAEIDNITIDGNSIVSSSGSVEFDDEYLITTGGLTIKSADLSNPLDTLTLTHDETDANIVVGSGGLNIGADFIEIGDTVSDVTGIITKGGARFIHNYHDPVGGGAIPSGANVFVGENAGNLTMGDTAVNVYESSTNTGFGSSTLTRNTTGYANSAFGYTSLFLNTTGHSNLAIGTESLYSNTTGTVGVAIGRQASRNNISGSGGVSAGYRAMYNNTTGNFNIGIGFESGRYIANGASNLTGDYNIFLGVAARALADNDQNEIVIGYNAIGNGSNTVTLGNTSIEKVITTGLGSFGGGLITTSGGTFGSLVAGQTELTSTIDPQLRLTHTDGVDETDFYTNADGELVIMPTSRTVYIGDGTDGDNALKFYSDTSIYMLHHDEDNSALKLSANDVTNYTQFGDDGIMTMHGTARVNKEFSLLLTDFNPGASGPTKALNDIYPTYEFTIDDDMHTAFEMPDDWAVGTNITVEVYWAIDEAYVTNSGEVQWSADWRAVAVGEVISGGASGNMDFGDVNIPATANTVVKTESTISGASLSADDLVAFNGARVDVDGGNDPTAEPYIISVRLEYIANSLGEAT